jgi:hypothetical protein
MKRDISKTDIVITYRKYGQNVHNMNVTIGLFLTEGDCEMQAELKKNAIFPK